MTGISFRGAPDKVKTNFLKEYWEGKRKLPKLTPVEQIFYYIMQGLRSLYLLPSSSLASIMTVAAATFLFAASFLVFSNLSNWISRAGGSLVITLYFEENASEADIDNYLQGLLDSGQVLSVDYVSKQEGLKNLRDDLGLQSAYLDGLKEDNPIPASADILLRPDETGINQVERTVKQLKTNELISSVVYGSDWAERFRRVFALIQNFGFAFILVVFALMVFLISNTIKLLIHTRRDEIFVMRLVGASPGTIKIPFVVGGAIQGLFGTCLGVLVCSLFYLTLAEQLASTIVLGIVLPPIEFFSPQVCASFILGGAILGAAGSLLSLNKYMGLSQVG